MSVGDLLGEVSGRSWEETLPYAVDFAETVGRIVNKIGTESRDDLIEIGMAVWTSMDVRDDLSEVLDGEASGDIVSLRRHILLRT